ncbi:MAG: hypothetical protein R3C03_21415 [Pirellulaceae bacterium]
MSPLLKWGVLGVSQKHINFGKSAFMVRRVIWILALSGALLGIRFVPSAEVLAQSVDDVFSPPIGRTTVMRPTLQENAPLPGPLQAGQTPDNTDYLNSETPGNLPSPSVPFIPPSVPGAGISSPTQAFPHSHDGRTPCSGCTPVCETRTIYVPKWETVYDISYRNCFRPEQRQRQVWVNRVVPEQIPEIENYTEMVPETRTREYVVYHTQKIPTPVQKTYQVMVPKEQIRQYTTFRTESYEVPVEENYTVMVPETRIKEYTVMREITEQIPDVEHYTVNVPETRVRPVVTYRDVEDVEMVSIPYTEFVEVERKKEVVVYEQRTETRNVLVPRFRMEETLVPYSEKRLAYSTQPKEVTKVETLQATRITDGQESFSVNEPKVRLVNETYSASEPVSDSRTESYTAMIPVPETVEVPYQETVMDTREVTRYYDDWVPYTEDIVRNYTVMVPYQETFQATKTVCHKIPEQRVQTVCQDQGHWQDVTRTVCDCECFEDECGNCKCCPTTRTICEKVWCPNPVTVQIPYTVYRQEVEQIPYSYTVTKQRPEQAAHRRFSWCGIARNNVPPRKSNMSPESETKTRRIQKTSFRRNQDSRGSLRAIRIR